MSLRPSNTFLEVDRERFTLKVRKRGLLTSKWHLEKTYPIAVGALGYTTPRGLYDVRQRAKDPDWWMPDEDWVPEKLRGTMIPGGAPENPIRERWIRLTDGGVGIHGTFATETLGTKASHGCIRMAPQDVIELYPQVPKGTLVHIT